jgi:hypothetical protein
MILLFIPWERREMAMEILAEMGAGVRKQLAMSALS